MISRKDIEELAQLSRLKLSEEEILSLEKDFTSILDYVGQIQSAQVNGDALVPELYNVMREDEVGKIVGSTPEQLLKSAPRVEGEYIVVRKIIDK